jgi:uncharacterized protein (TIGR02285 family)
MSTLARCANLLCQRTSALIRIALTAFLLPLCLASAEEPLLVFYNERPPYLVPGAGGVVTGLTADPTAYALQKARIPFKWVAMPSARQIYLLQENHARLGAVGWFKNSEREKFAKFSTVLYQDKQTVVLARSDNRKIAAIKSVEELLSDRSLKLLRKFGYSYGQDLDAQIVRRAPVSLQVTVENVNMIQMIQVRRADYMFIAPEEAGRAIALAGLRVADFQTRTLPDMPHGEKRYLLFSRLVDDDTIKLINKYIDEYGLARK